MARKPDPLSVEYLLLGIIMKQSIHAYDLDKMLNSTEDLNIVWRFNQSQLYAVLDKLERNGLIMSTISTGSAFPFRKVYSLTEHGLSEFRKWKTSPVEQPNAMRSNFLVKLYFLENEPLSVFESIVRARLQSVKNGLMRKQIAETMKQIPLPISEWCLNSESATFSPP